MTDTQRKPRTAMIRQKCGALTLYASHLTRRYETCVSAERCMYESPETKVVNWKTPQPS
jgi:hypothetical protein